MRKFPETAERDTLKFLTENFLLILIAFVSGGMLIWPLVNQRGAGANLDTLSATRLMNEGNSLVIDIRGNGEFNAGHLPNSKNIPLADIEKRIDEIPAGKKVLVVCENGQTSGKASAMLKKAGREEVFGLGGGVSAWRQAGLPIIK